MTIYRFDAFAFDTRSDELRKHGEAVSLRPKTARLLGLLIGHRDQPLSRDELLARVWPTTHAGSNNLFQAISELRSAFKPINPIRTIPNLGYEWCAPVRQQRRWVPVAAVACLLVAIVSSFAVTTAQTPSSVASMPPAYRAFFAGMDHIDNGHPDQAVTQFEMAIAENPAFSEAHLLLAQSWMQLDELGRASDVLRRLISADGQDGYAQMTAMEMMGEIEQRGGAGDATLDWVRRAFDSAEDSGYVCAAADLESRLLDLEAIRQDDEEQPLDGTQLAQASPRSRLCNEIPPRLESSVIESCKGGVGALVDINPPGWRQFKLS